ncbi:hypothetical protein H5410_050724, partial [Solanum commersonii]
SRDRRCTQGSALWSASSPFNFYLQHLHVLDHWAIGNYFTELLDDASTSPFPRRLDLFLQGSAHWNIKRGDPQAFFSSSFQPPCSFLPSNVHFKEDVSNSTTQDSIMNVHNKTQLTHARINCILKDSSCDTPLSKILKLTILASNASSSSTNVFICPHTKE